MNPFEPSPEQRAILDDPGPQVVLAGAGVGKTAVLTERIVRTIVNDNVLPETILALTFTRAAAEEMRSRIARELGVRAARANPNALWAGTYHSFAGGVIREFGVRIGVAPAARLLTEAGKWALLDRLFNQLTFEALPVRHPATAFASILGFVSDAQNHLITPDAIDVLVASLAPTAAGAEVQALVARWAELSRAYRAYQEAKLQAGALDFGDQITYAVDLLEQHADVAAELRRRFTHVYVDEYQDTNPAQRRLLLNLIGSGNRRLFVIGDDDQAIFRFQGATVQNILGLPDEAELSEAKPVVRTLVLNRRSLPPILDLANPIAAKIRQRRHKELRHFRDGRAALGAYVADTDRDEAQWIAQRIHELQGAASAGGELAAWGSYAVLCRQRELAQTLAWALAERGIPFRRAEPVPLLERWEIDEVRALLEVIGAPDDDVALARVLASPRWRIGDADLWALARWRLDRRAGRSATGAAPALDEERDLAFGDALLDAVVAADAIAGLSAEGRARLAALRTELIDLAALARSGTVAELVAQVIERGGYVRELAAGVHPDDVEALRNLARLQRLAAGFAEGEGLPGLRAFLRFLSQADEADDRALGEGERPAPDPHAVWLTTVHRAKGLEWPVVFIPGLAKGRFAPRTPAATDADAPAKAPYPLKAARAGLPALAADAFTSDAALTQAREQRKLALTELEEDDERRLFYVAVTRAREHLYLSRAHWYETRQTPAEASPFWVEALATGLCAELGMCEPSPANPNLTLGPLRPAVTPVDQALKDAAGFERRITTGGGDAVVDELLGSTPPPEWPALRAAADTLIQRVVNRASIPNRPRPLVELPITSYSALNTFAACERRYKYAVLDRLPQAPHAAALGGATMHRALAAASLAPGDGELPAPDDLPGEIEAALRERPHLLAAYRSSRFATRAPHAVEQAFTLALEHGVIHGTIDRIDRLAGGSLEIVDFKTGRPRAPAALQDDLQLPIYSLAAEELFSAASERIVASLFYLETSTEWRLPWGPAAARHTRERLNALLQRLRNTDFPLTDDRRLCRTCDFKHICGR